MTIFKRSCSFPSSFFPPGSRRSRINNTEKLLPRALAAAARRIEDDADQNQGLEAAWQVGEKEEDEDDDGVRRGQAGPAEARRRFGPALLAGLH